jgi:hypothetical protein
VVPVPAQGIYGGSQQGAGPVTRTSANKVQDYWDDRGNLYDGNSGRMVQPASVMRSIQPPGAQTASRPGSRGWQAATPGLSTAAAGLTGAAGASAAPRELPPPASKLFPQYARTAPNGPPGDALAGGPSTKVAPAAPVAAPAPLQGGLAPEMSKTDWGNGAEAFRNPSFSFDGAIPSPNPDGLDGSRPPVAAPPATPPTLTPGNGQVNQPAAEAEAPAEFDLQRRSAFLDAPNSIEGIKNVRRLLADRAGMPADANLNKFSVAGLERQGQQSMAGAAAQTNWAANGSDFSGQPGFSVDTAGIPAPQADGFSREQLDDAIQARSRQIVAEAYPRDKPMTPVSLGTPPPMVIGKPGDGAFNNEAALLAYAREGKQAPMSPAVAAILSTGAGGDVIGGRNGRIAPQIADLNFEDGNPLARRRISVTAPTAAGAPTGYWNSALSYR